MLLSLAALVVAASTACLPFISGHGTVLHQAVVLGAHSLVAHIVSFSFAESHKIVVWLVAIAVNVGLFLAPAVLLLVGARLFSMKAQIGVVVMWGILYLCLLFFLCPATDGP